jgi:hypothetical protein
MSRCRNATSRRPERRAHPRHVVRAVPPPRPHARLPEAGVAPSRCPIPEAAPTPRRLGSRGVVWRVSRSTRRDYCTCSRSPADTRPAPRPGWFHDLASVTYKGADRPRACTLESPSPRSATACHGHCHR